MNADTQFQKVNYRPVNVPLQKKQSCIMIIIFFFNLVITFLPPFAISREYEKAF